jgi:hypothetical protein
MLCAKHTTGHRGRRERASSPSIFKLRNYPASGLPPQTLPTIQTLPVDSPLHFDGDLRRTSSGQAKHAPSRTFSHRPDHHEAPRPPLTRHLQGSAQKAASGFPFPKANLRTIGGQLPVLSPPCEAYGSFLPWPYVMRSRGSPNFLQLVDSETRTYAGSMHMDGCMVRLFTSRPTRSPVERVQPKTR